MGVWSLSCVDSRMHRGELMARNRGPDWRVCSRGVASAVTVAAVVAALCPVLLGGAGAAAGTQVAAGARGAAVAARWGLARRVAGFAALNRGLGGDAGLRALSCASAGNCAAGGFYTD